MTKTEDWALSHGLCADDIVPPVEGCDEPYKRTSEEIAIRTIILHAVAAVGYGVDPGRVVGWLKERRIWSHVSPNEQHFFEAENPSDEERNEAKWRQEAQWALLWAIGKVESLGLPTHTCDTARLVNEIMPGLGEPVDAFVSSANLRPPSVLLAEDDRVYNLHCCARQDYQTDTVPEDLVYGVLLQRHYAFEWLSGVEEWDDVRTDT